jgi:hypothetical protein
MPKKREGREAMTSVFAGVWLVKNSFNELLYLEVSNVETVVDRHLLDKSSHLVGRIEAQDENLPE